MKKFIFAFLGAVAASSLFALDPFVGEYRGKAETDGHFFTVNPNVEMRVSKPDKDTYKVVLLPYGLRRSTPYLEVTLPDTGQDEIIIPTQPRYGLSGRISKGGKAEFTGVSDQKPLKINFEQYERVSPTMGLKAPSGAEILIGKDGMGKWTLQDGAACTWKVLEDGVEIDVEPALAGKKRVNKTAFTKESFESFKLHLEFFLPETYEKGGQARCNSGLYIGPVELQILDTFHGEGIWNECGALYKFLPPQVNAALPAGRWQTYDVEFTAPKFDEDGKLTAYPRISAKLNGIKIHDDIELTQATDHSELTATGYKYKPGGLKISLQDHGDFIRFRNMWIKTLAK